MTDGDRATWLKIRTWSVIQSRHRAGETAEALAHDYGVPFAWVQFVLLPENDLDARYGRPSDRTATAKADLLDAEQEIARLKTELDAAAHARTMLQTESYRHAAEADRYCSQYVDEKKRADKAEAKLSTLQMENDRLRHAHANQSQEPVLAAPAPAPLSEAASHDVAGERVLELPQVQADLRADTVLARARQWLNAAPRERREVIGIGDYDLVRDLTAHLAAAEQARHLAETHALDLAGRIAFLCARDIPNTEQGAKASLLTRLADAEQARTTLQAEVDRLTAENASLHDYLTREGL